MLYLRQQFEKSGTILEDGQQPPSAASTAAIGETVMISPYVSRDVFERNFADVVVTEIAMRAARQGMTSVPHISAYNLRPGQP